MKFKYLTSLRTSIFRYPNPCAFAGRTEGKRSGTCVCGFFTFCHLALPDFHLVGSQHTTAHHEIRQSPSPELVGTPTAQGLKDTRPRRISKRIQCTSDSLHFTLSHFCA